MEFFQRYFNWEWLDPGEGKSHVYVLPTQYADTCQTKNEIHAYVLLRCHLLKRFGKKFEKKRRKVFLPFIPIIYLLEIYPIRKQS